MCRLNSAGQPHGPTAYVFGDEIGKRVMSARKAWGNTCRKVGIEDLRIHDLRHEAGSRFLEAGWPLHHVQAMLGHANLKTTSTYLNVTLDGLHASMRKLDEQRKIAKNVPSTPRTHAGFLGPDPSPVQEKSFVN